jgi:uncharacterized protein (TIGR04255 family)
MTNLAKAPLIYTIGVTRFPRLPDLSRFEADFHEAIRTTGYPLKDEIEAPIISASFSDAGLQIEQHKTRLLQFATADRQWAFILTEEILALHTIAYPNHQVFADRFRTGLSALVGISGIAIELVEAVGMRYVDLVVPRDGETLRDYLEPWVLPIEEPTLSERMTLIEGMYVATYRSDVGELRFQALRNPPTTLPPELDTPLIKRNGWKRDLPKGEFAVVDVDHGTRFDTPAAMDVDMVCGHLLELRKVAKDLFLSFGTDFAMRVWNGEA